LSENTLTPTWMPVASVFVNRASDYQTTTAFSGEDCTGESIILPLVDNVEYWQEMLANMDKAGHSFKSLWLPRGFILQYTAKDGTISSHEGSHTCTKLDRDLADWS